MNFRDVSKALWDGVTAGIFFGFTGAGLGMVAGFTGGEIIKAVDREDHHSLFAAKAALRGTGMLAGVGGFAAGVLRSCGVFAQKPTKTPKDCGIAMLTLGVTELAGSALGYALIAAPGTVASIGTVLADVAVGSVVTTIPLSCLFLCCVAVCGSKSAFTCFQDAEDQDVNTRLLTA